MCRKHKTNKEPPKALSYDACYLSITESISKYIKRTFRTKIIFQIVFGAITSALLVALTVVFILLTNNLIDKITTGKITDFTFLSSIITSSVTYATSIIGTLVIVIKYMFNKQDMSDNSDLIRCFLENGDDKKTTDIGPKTIDQMVNSTLDDSGNSDDGQSKE